MKRARSKSPEIGHRKLPIDVDLNWESVDANQKKQKGQPPWRVGDEVQLAFGGRGAQFLSRRVVIAVGKLRPENSKVRNGCALLRWVLFFEVGLALS
jgi:hypothetical protein